MQSWPNRVSFPHQTHPGVTSFMFKHSGQSVRVLKCLFCVHFVSCMFSFSCFKCLIWDEGDCLGASLSSAWRIVDQSEQQQTKNSSDINQSDSKRGVFRSTSCQTRRRCFDRALCPCLFKPVCDELVLVLLTLAGDVFSLRYVTSLSLCGVWRGLMFSVWHLRCRSTATPTANLMQIL